MVDLAAPITVGVRRPAQTDRFGNPTSTADDTIDGCMTAPLSSEERTDGQATVVTGRSLYAPPGADLRAEDLVHLPGDPADTYPWSVDGDPAVWNNPLTATRFGVVAVLTRARG